VAGGRPVDRHRGVLVARRDGGLDVPSAGIGAAVPLTMVLIEVVGRRVLRRRRENQVRHRLA